MKRIILEYSYIPLFVSLSGREWNSRRKYSFLSIPLWTLKQNLKLSNKKMDFPFPPLKLTDKEMGEYSKIILFIYFHSISFPPPKRGLTIRLKIEFMDQGLGHDPWIQLFKRLRRKSSRTLHKSSLTDHFSFLFFPLKERITIFPPQRKN